MADIAKGVRSFTIGTAISRVMGLARESVFAFLFGAGRSTDAFNAAFRIPNLLRDLFAETSLSAAFVPVLTEQKGKGKDAENLIASNIFNTLLIIVGIVSIIGIFLSPFLAKIIAPGFGSIPAKLALTGRLTGIMFPFLLFVALAAWAMSYLNTEDVFFTPSLAPAFFNVFSIAMPLALFAYYTHRGGDPIYGAAIGVTVGGLMQFVVQGPSLFRKNFKYKLYINFRDPAFRKVMVLFIPVAIGLSASRINVFVNTVLVSFLEERSLTWLNYAFRIMHLPLGLFGIAVGAVALPTLSRFVAEGNLSEIRKTLDDSLKMVFFLTVPTSIIIAFLSVPITSIIYQHGRFTAFDTSATAQALILYVVGIPFMSGLRNLAAVFYAYKDAKTPMLASFASVGINLILNITLMWVMGYRAFPLSTTISALVNIAILFAFLPRKIGRFEMMPVVRYFMALTLTSVLGGLGGWALNAFLLKMTGISFLATIFRFIFCGAASFVIFYVACLVLDIKEAKEYLRRFTRG